MGGLTPFNPPGNQRGLFPLDPHLSFLDGIYVCSMKREMVEPVADIQEHPCEQKVLRQFPQLHQVPVISSTPIHHFFTKTAEQGRSQVHAKKHLTLTPNKLITCETNVKLSKWCFF